MTIHNQPILLVVEDDEGLQSQFRWSFEGYKVVIASDRISALEAVDQHQPPVVTLDLGLPPDPANASEGLAALNEILKRAPFTKVVVVTGNDDHSVALKAIADGAYDFCQKPIDIDTLKLIVDRAAHLAALEQENRDLRKTKNQDGALGGIIGTSPQLTKVLHMIEKVADSDTSILILGESGTGKELVAQSLHQLSQRNDKPLTAINCAAIPGELLESELFGYEKGAFTGATKTKLGKIEKAAGGTLFLDEIGDMPISLQAKILRFLEERVFERVGGHEEIAIDVRIICATHQNLQNLITEKSFREDLYYRIAEIEILIPPLRERGGDINLLARAFLDQFTAQQDTQVNGFTPESVQILDNYSWPGNIRELKNTIKRAVIMCEGNQITPDDLNIDPVSTARQPAEDLKRVRAQAEHHAITNALIATNYNIATTAKTLGVSRPTLYTLMEKLGIKRKRSSAPS
ncbi:MAG: PEP-CTERM-box response regulator transcription factor [Gammaproteobacteria bacterium]|nr:MAG: PEP-CTERM-box response regulator transcription factor [Gammaproteobacteria bacterium]